MGRIRTIKPEFWRDEKIYKLSHSCALFFISCWNFADDEGKFPNNPKQLQLNAPIFRTKDIKTHLKKLHEIGLILFSEGSERVLRGVSEGSDWCLIVNWDHQKIDRPRPPKIKASEIKWVNADGSSNVRRSFDDHSTQVKDSIGEDRIYTPIPPSGDVCVNEETKKLAREDLHPCIEAWSKTLKFFGKTRDPLFDEEPIARAVARYGVERVARALTGPRFEQKKENYDPGKFVRISRYLDAKNFDWFENLADEENKTQRKEITEW